MTEPRWTVDKYGALMYRLPEGGLGNPAIIFSMTTPEDVSLAAHEELVAAVRDADTLRQAREHPQNGQVIERATYWLAHAPCEDIADSITHDLIIDLRNRLLDLLAPIPDTGADDG